jgi:hypothetical protein
MIGIFDSERIFIFKGDYCISKIYVVFSQILGNLPWVPFILHGLSVCTFRAHSKMDDFIFNYKDIALKRYKVVM